MKTIGIIGGMSWESTACYYRWLNEGVRERLGGHHSARIVMSSLDFAAIKEMQTCGRWTEAGVVLAAEARALEKAGADLILLATNTMHKVAAAIEAAIEIPFVHLADATAEKIRQHGVSRVGLLATSYTMDQDFYKNRLKAHGVGVMVPACMGQRARVNTIIFDELCRGIQKSESKSDLIRAAQAMIDEGAAGIILGCTELTLLTGPDDFSVPVFDTTRIHIEKALELALS